MQNTAYLAGCRRGEEKRDADTGLPPNRIHPEVQVSHLVVLLAVLKGGYDIYLFVFHYCLSKYMSQALSLCPCEIFFCIPNFSVSTSFYQICLLQLCFRSHCQGVIGLTRNHVKVVVSCELGGTENNPGGTPLCVPISREDGGKTGSSATKWIQSSRLSARKRSEKSEDTSP